jgi:hypothetical protein
MSEANQRMSVDELLTDQRTSDLIATMEPVEEDERSVKITP